VKHNAYWTEEVQVKVNDKEKWVNEFLIGENIGRGAFSKVKQVIRTFKSDEGNDEQKEFAMKMMHKPTLKRERAMRYNDSGEMEMINNLDKVYNEVEIWASLHHDNLVTLYEIIDSEEHDYMYLILEMADLGQLAKWDFEKEVYVLNQGILQYLAQALQTENIEEMARFLFQQLGTAILHLHEEARVIHRDIKLDNILFDGHHGLVKLTDFTVSRDNIGEATRLFDS